MTAEEKFLLRTDFTIKVGLVNMYTPY